MEITTYTNFRKHLKSFLDNVLIKHSPLFVTRSKGEDIVVLSKSDYESMQETFYLLKSPKNASRLLAGLEEYEKGLGKENFVRGMRCVFLSQGWKTICIGRKRTRKCLKKSTCLSRRLTDLLLKEPGSLNF